MAAATNALDSTLRDLRPGLTGAIAFSFFANLLMLAVPIYTMQVFDRVLSSGRVETLLLLTLITAGALLTLGALEAIRTSIMARLQRTLGQRLSGPLVRACIVPGVRGGEAVRDLGQIRTTLTSPGLMALFDIPWLPFFVALIWALHPDLGLFALGSAVLLIVLAIAGELVGRRSIKDASRAQRAADRLIEAISINASVVRAMHMLPGLGARFEAAHETAMERHQSASERAGVFQGAARFLRLLVQAGVMGLGAWLVLRQQLSPGGMIAASILLGRALVPVEQLIPSWKTLIQGRDSLARLRVLLGAAGPPRDVLPLPAPEGRLEVDQASFHVQMKGGPAALLKGVSFVLGAGESLGIVGASGSGKSTLCRLLAGAAPAGCGSVRLDGAEIGAQLGAGFGRHVGYLPQEVCLFAGTVTENITRFAEADPAAVVAAARLAGVHEAILSLPKGYETEIGDGGRLLSGGQRQRIGLARALFGQPRLVVLDEPNAHLDGDGEAGLLRALAELRRNRTTVVIAAHRMGVLGQCDRLLVLEDGAMARLAPREEIMKQLVRPVRAA